MTMFLLSLWPCAQIEPLPAATVDKLQSRIVDGAAPILANLPHMTAADELTMRKQAGWANDVATKAKRVGQSTPIGKPGEAYECTYRLKGAGSRAINRYRYTALPGKSSPPIYTNGAFVLRLNKLKSRWEACAVDTVTPCYYASISSHSALSFWYLSTRASTSAFSAASFASPRAQLTASPPSTSQSWPASVSPSKEFSAASVSASRASGAGGLAGACCSSSSLHGS